MNFDIANLVMNIEQANSKDWIDILSALLGIGSFITAICSIIYTAKSVQQQKEQWLKDEYLKYEVSVIMEGRKLFQEAYENILKLTAFYLGQNAFKTFELNTSKSITNNSNNFYYQSINKLQTLYNKNKMIFDSNGLAEGFNYISFLSYLLSSTKNVEIVTYVPIKEVEKTLVIDIETNKKIEKQQYRAIFWYCFPVLTFKLLHEGLVVSNPKPENCYEEFNTEIYNEYVDVITTARNSIMKMAEIFDSILKISKDTYKHEKDNDGSLLCYYKSKTGDKK